MKYLTLFLLLASCLICAQHPVPHEGTSPFLDIVSQLTIVKLPDTPENRTFESVVKWLRHCHVGNILINKNNFGPGSLEEQAARVNLLTCAIYGRNYLIPLKAADQEGGRVQRILGTPIPAPMSIEDDSIEKYATILAHETKFVGINLCLGPVLDIPAPGNFIGDRAFGKDPASVISRARTWLHVLKEHGLLTVGKHFPGHGCTNEDTHRHAAYVDKTKEELQAWDMKPFFALMDQLDGVMSSHVVYPALDPHHIGTYSSIIMTDLLKDFDGLRITDSLGMLAATPDQINFEQTAMAMAMNAINALNAGCDLVILGRPEFGFYTPTPTEHMCLIDRIMGHMANAMQQGEISNERLAEALFRVKEAKKKIALPDQLDELLQEFVFLFELLDFTTEDTE